jgi:glycosyltransferase involved in cell wall biosynthesis
MIVSLYINTEKRQQLSENAVKLSEKFDERTMTEKTEQLYSKLINPK